VASPPFRWDLVLPTHRFIFAVDAGSVVDLGLPGDTPADRFTRYLAAKGDYPTHGMITWPNTVLLRGEQTVLVDPGLLLQGPPLLLALARLGVDACDVDLVVNTHAHSDHIQANVHFPAAAVTVHRLEHQEAREAYRAEEVEGRLRLLEGDEGEIGPGLRYLRTPGHTAGSVCLVAETAQGRLLLAGDTVGPLPAYFDQMRLPEGFPGREDLLRSWAHLRKLAPALVVPGHNPPFRLD
jgi:glyoxylase-like metal-dependent hydrolase (beta-lactamase superfamily II)